MSMRARKFAGVPELTARVARTIYPQGNEVMRVLDVLRLRLDDADFADLFASRGRPAHPPGRLALVTLLQFMEELTDREAADAVRARIDWKYALCLELDDAGFDHTVLSEFRGRLLGHGAEQRVFEAVLALAKEAGVVHARGRQRSDSTHILAHLRERRRESLVWQTLRHALDDLAACVPHWLQAWLPPAWIERYALHAAMPKPPRSPAERLAWIEQLGEDGMSLLDAVFDASAPCIARRIDGVEALRQVWLQHFFTDCAGAAPRLRWRSKDDLPPASVAICSPHETQARRCSKGRVVWTGFKVHLTETCDVAQPSLITNVHTTASTMGDSTAVPAIHEALECKQLLPSVHVADTAYVHSPLSLRSRQQYALELIGPTRDNTVWQARSQGGFALSDFAIDYDARKAICPQGKNSVRWLPTHSSFGQPIIKVRWSRRDCRACPVHGQCTRSEPPMRQITIRPHEHQSELAARREFERSAEFAGEYAHRLGVEATISQIVRTCGIRRTRYVGMAKTHLAHLMSAAAVNVRRLLRWMAGDAPEQVRPTALQRLLGVPA